MDDCFVCDLNRRADAGEDPTFVARTSTGYVRINANQFYAGYTYFAADTCAAELHELPAEVRTVHLEEMALVAEAVFRGFRARKLNYEALGNTEPHLHWHLVPRHVDDTRPWAPISGELGLPPHRVDSPGSRSGDDRCRARDVAGCASRDARRARRDVRVSHSQGSNRPSNSSRPLSTRP